MSCDCGGRAEFETGLFEGFGFRHLASVIRRFFLLSLTLFLFVACDRKGRKPLRVGMDMSYPPFEMRDTQGNPAGVSVDLARALGEDCGREVEFENMPFDGLIPALKTGRVDMVISSMTATEERAQSIDFSEPYWRTGLCLLTAAKSDIRSAADLDQAGRKVAVVRATTGELWAKGSLRRAEVLSLPKETACVLEVTQGKADAFIYDQMSIFKHWQRNPDTTRPILQPFQQESWAIGLRHGNDALKSQVNEFLKSFRAAGGFDRLGDKYLKEEKEAFQKLGIPFLF